MGRPDAGPGRPSTVGGRASADRRRHCTVIGHLLQRVSPWTSSTSGPMRSTDRRPAPRCRAGRARRRCAPRIGAASSPRARPGSARRIQLAGVGVGALGVGEVVAPQQVADADLVAAVDLVDAGRRRGEEAVAVDVLARLHRRSASLEERRRTCGCCGRRPTSRPCVRRGRAPTRRRSRRSTYLRSGWRSNTPDQSSTQSGRAAHHHASVA